MEVRPQSASKSRLALGLAVLAFLVTTSLAGYLYVQNTRLNQDVGSLRNSVAALQQELTSTDGSSAIGNTNSSGINTTLIYDYANSSVVTVEGLQRVSSPFGATYEPVLGSGFVVLFDGAYYVVSNYHVVQNDINVSVTFHDGNGYAGRVVGSDPYSDLAVLTVVGAPSTEYHPLSLVPSSGLKVGEPVVAIGNPYGLSGSLTEGLVSQLGRTIQDETSGNYSIADVIQISTPINPGNSGGPLMDSRGQVVGMTTAIVSGSQGIGFAIPSDTIIKELPDLIDNGSYALHPYLGISEADMSYDLASASNINLTYGVLIESVVSGGPAAQAGLEAGATQKIVDGSTYVVGGDIIVSVNGTRIANSDALSTWLEEHALPGQTVQLGIMRGGSLLTISVRLGTRPPI